MGFTDKQVRALGRSVRASATRTRMSSGKERTYIEGWYAVAQANRIFGLDGWDRETMETKCIQAREARGTVAALYSAKVRVRVRTGDAVVIREGHGTGEAQGSSSGEVHDRALKTAETDATKRALATFGKAFGLALYAGGRGTARTRGEARTKDAERPANLGRDPAPTSATAAAPATTPTSVVTEMSATPSLEAPDVAGAIAPSTPAQARPRIDKSVLAFPEVQRVRDKEHLRYVATQPCLLCSATPSDPHHIRFAQPRAMARKVGDDFTVPLCRKHHRDLHDSGNEAAWWRDLGIEPLEIARDLWNETAKSRSTQQPGELAMPSAAVTFSD